MRFVWTLLLAAALAEDAPPTAPVAVETEDRAAWTPEEWIAQVDARAASVPGMRYSVQRTTERGTTKVEDRWRIVQYGAKFRIDYFGDTARQITFDGKHLVDYVPANRMAMRFDTSKMDPVEAATLLANVLKRVAVPNFRLGQVEQVTWTVSEQDWGGRAAIVLDGAGREGSSIRYVIDRERVAALHSEIQQAGQIVLRAESHDLREVQPGVWLPHRVEMRAPDAGGEARVSLHLTKVAVLADSPAQLFQTDLDPSVPVEERP